MKHLSNLLDGFVSVLDLQPKRESSYVIENEGFSADRGNLTKDVRAVGRDLVKGVKRAYGQQSIASKGYEQAG